MSGVSEDEEMSLTPEELREIALDATTDLVPEKSRLRYYRAYNTFIEWQQQNKCSNLSENVFIAYFKHKSATWKPSTLWSQYSMLRSMMSLNKNVNISLYTELIAFIKNQSKGFQSKKAKVFTTGEIKEFLDGAPDVEYLASKVSIKPVRNETVGDVDGILIQHSYRSL